VKMRGRRACDTRPRRGSASSALTIERSAQLAAGKGRRTDSATTTTRAGSATAPLELGAVTWSLYSWSPPLPGRWRRRAMPSRLRYSCRWPICPTKLERPGYCDRHRKSLGSGWAQRPSKGNYRGDWPKIRARVLTEEPACRVCGAPATEVDHILPVAMGGTHERSNLRGICLECHRTATSAIPRRRGGRPA
jgi:5-methylcytosine-specific restriction protein A